MRSFSETLRSAMPLAVLACAVACTREPRPRVGAGATPPSAAASASGTAQSEAKKGVQGEAKNGGGGAEASALDAKSLAGMPPGAALYFVSHWDLLQRTEEQLRRPFGRIWYAKGSDEEMESAEVDSETPYEPITTACRMARELHIDGKRALVAAVVAPDEARARRAVDALARGTDAELDRALDGLKGEVVLYRVVVPIADGAGVDPNGAARSLAKEVSKTELSPCSSDPRCAAFSPVKPLAVATGGDRALAVYVEARSIRLDVAKSLFGSGSDPQVFDALVRFGARTGGPEAPHCTAFDAGAGAGAGLCIDADQAAALRTTVHYGTLVAALRKTDPATRRRLAAEGRPETRRSLELAAPSRRLLDDGTLFLDVGDRGFELRGTWALTAASRASLERAFTSKSGELACAKYSFMNPEVYPGLWKAFGDPGKDFRNAERVRQSVQEAGWGAWLVLFGRSWPNALMADNEFMLPALGRICIRTGNGRLEMQLHQDSH